MGKRVHLANYSLFNLDLVQKLTDAEELIPGRLIGVSGIPDDLSKLPCAEGGLAKWLKAEHGAPVTIYLLPNDGGIAIIDAYKTLAARLNPDALLLVDGGVDSLMRGDEEAPGTLIEDGLSLAGVRALPIPVKILACLGMGTEIEEGLAVSHALENIAALAKAGAFLGSCALTPDMEAFQFYESACRHVWEQSDQPKSHISTRVIPAVHGEFGDYHMYSDDQRLAVSISPLMGLYWFFDAHTVIEKNLILEMLAATHSKAEAFFRYQQMRQGMRLRRANRNRY